MKNIILLFLFLIPVFLFAQYPATGNKSRLGYQTTGDGLIWRGVAADTVLKPRVIAHAYFQLDTVNAVLRRYIATKGSWQVVGGGTAIDSLVYSTIKGLNDSIQAEKQTLTFINPLLGISDGNSVDLSGLLTGYVTGSGTNNRIPKWSALTNLTNSNVQDDGTAVSILSSKPFMLGQWTTAGRPTGTSGYMGFNTTFNWLDIYSVSGWVSPLQSSLTGGLGTAGRVLYTDANGRATASGNLTYTGTRFQTGGSIRIGYNNASNDTASIEKVIDGNSKIVRFNNPGSVGGYSSGYVFRGGQNSALATVNTFRIYTNSPTIPGSVYVGNVTEVGANSGNAATNFGVLNKITSTTTYDSGINLHPLGSPNNFLNYRSTTGKQFGIFIGGASNNNNFLGMNDALTFGVFAGFQFQPLGNGYGSSWVFSAKNDASTPVEILRLQGKDGNICLGCTNAQYKLYTTSTDAYGIPTGTTGQRPTIVTGTTPLRFNSTTGFLEYGVFPSTWNSITLGTVTSVGLSLPSIFSVSGSPVTTSGTLSATFTGGDTRQVLRGDGIWANTLDSFRINQSLASVERFEVNGNILLNRGSGSNKLILTRNWNQEISAGGSNGNMNFVNGSGTGFQNYFILGTASGQDTMFTMHFNGLGVAVGKSNKIQARLHVKGAGTTTGKTMLLEDSGGADILTVTDDKTIQAHGYGTGTKEAADLSKTESVYDAVFATDGTVIERHDKIERYYTITSTSSPQTLSNDYSDNLINQGGTQATFTLTFPASPVDGQVLKITYNNAITTLTLDGNGNTIVGSAVTTGVAGSQRAFKFYTGIGWIKLY